MFKLYNYYNSNNQIDTIQWLCIDDNSVLPRPPFCDILTNKIQMSNTKLSRCAICRIRHLKWPLHILNHVSHSHLSMSSRIKHDWFFLFFINGDRHIFLFWYNNYNGYFVDLQKLKQGFRTYYITGVYFIESFFTPRMNIALEWIGQS